MFKFAGGVNDCQLPKPEQELVKLKEACTRHYGGSCVKSGKS